MSLLETELQSRPARTPEVSRGSLRRRSSRRSRMVRSGLVAAALALSVLACCPGDASAETERGTQKTLAEGVELFPGGPTEARDVHIPSGFSGGLRIVARAADGGRRYYDDKMLINHHYANGGGGATVEAGFEVGASAIPPGSRLRVITGRRGQSKNTAIVSPSGGGGGSAVLLLTPDKFHREDDADAWQVLVAAGAGGGAMGAAVSSDAGGNGDAADCDDSAGKTGGTSTGGFPFLSFGGAGANAPSDTDDWFWEDVGGAAKGMPAGAAGVATGIKGGWGFGGGGGGTGPGGGGGGGYCGGDAGVTNKSGKGGSSWITPDYEVIGEHRLDGSRTKSPKDGWVEIELGELQPPVEVNGVRDATIDGWYADPDEVDAILMPNMPVSPTSFEMVGEVVLRATNPDEFLIEFMEQLGPEYVDEVREAKLECEESSVVLERLVFAVEEDESVSVTDLDGSYTPAGILALENYTEFLFEGAPPELRCHDVDAYPRALTDLRGTYDVEAGTLVVDRAMPGKIRLTLTSEASPGRTTE